MDKLDQILNETSLSTQEVTKLIKNKYDENDIINIINSQNNEIARLKTKYKNSKLSNEELIKNELKDYMSVLINLINNQYGNLIPNDRLNKLNSMLINDSIEIINDEKDSHDISANSKTGKIIVNLAKLGKNENNPKPDIYRQMAVANGSLPHELFHIIIQMLKPEEIADERMIINMSNGEIITCRGMVGFMLNEGFAEKFSAEVCKNNNLYYQMAPQYLSYVDLCNYIMENYPQINKSTIFSLDESDVINCLNKEEKEKYYQAELISYAIRHKGKNIQDIKSTRIEKLEIDYSQFSQDTLNELQNYYLNKNNKLKETSMLSYDKKQL